MTLDDLIAADQARLDVLLKARFEQGASLTEIARLKAMFAALPPPAPAPVPSADVLWRWDATSVAPFGIHAKEPSRVSLVQAGGRPAVRLLTLPGDTNVYGSGNAVRTDLRLSNALSDATEGREWWFKHGVWFPSDYVDTPPSTPSMWNWGVVLDWHDDRDTPGSQGPVQLVTYSTGMRYQVYGGAPGGKALGEFSVGPIVRNLWHDFKYHIRWSSTTGFCDGWLNSKQFMAYKGPTLITGNGAYLKLANYGTQTSPSAVLHGAAVRAKTEAGLA